PSPAESHADGRPSHATDPSPHPRTRNAVTTSTSTSRTTLVAQCQAIIAALTALTVTDYTLGGKDYPKAALIAAFQSSRDAATLNASTKKSYQNAVIAETAQAVSARSL